MVSPGNTAPVATDDTSSTVEGQWVLIDVLVNDADADGDGLTITNLTQPANGTVILSGQVEYTPNPGFTGQDTFTYTAYDGMANSNVATVYLTVIPGNTAPVATDDTSSIPWHGYLGPALAVHLDRQRHRVLNQIGRIRHWPGRIRDQPVAALHLPNFFGQMRGHWHHELGKHDDCFAARAIGSL